MQCASHFGLTWVPFWLRGLENDNWQHDRSFSLAGDLCCIPLLVISFYCLLSRLKSTMVTLKWSGIGYDKRAKMGHKTYVCLSSIILYFRPSSTRLNVHMRHEETETYILKHWFPLFSGANGIRSPHDQTLRVDTQVLAISRLQGYPATEKWPTKFFSGGTLGQTSQCLKNDRS